MADVNFQLISATGDGLALASDRSTDSGSFWLLSSPVGFGLPVPETRTKTSATDGVRYASKRVKERTITLRIEVWGLSRSDTEAKLRQLASALRTIDGMPLPRLQALYNTGLQLELPFLYQAGGEKTYDENGPNVVEWPVVVECPDPYWKALAPQAIASMSPAGTTTDLLADLASLPLASSSVLGSVTIQNVGDVAAFPVWTWSGPATSVTITTVLGSFTFNTVGSGETRVIDTASKTIVDASGANKYTTLGTAPKFGALPAGNSIVQITATGTDTTSKLVGVYKPRYELVF